MLPSHQVRTVIASLLLVVATMVVVVPSVGLWEPPLDASFPSHVHSGQELAAGEAADPGSFRDALATIGATVDGASANRDRATDDRPNTASALQRSDLLAHWTLLSVVVLAVLLLAPRSPRTGWAPVQRHERVPRSAELRGTRSWRAPPILV